MRHFQRTISGVLLQALLWCSMPGCSIFQKGKKKWSRNSEPLAMVNLGPQRVGTVTLVNEQEHFVLIDTGIAGVPAPGTALKCLTDDAESGVVTVGKVTRRPFVVADIVRGEPKKGDGVFQ